MQKSQISHFWRHWRVHCVVAIRSFSWLNFASCAWHCILSALAINGTFAISASLSIKSAPCAGSTCASSYKNSSIQSSWNVKKPPQQQARVGQICQKTMVSTALTCTQTWLQRCGPWATRHSTPPKTPRRRADRGKPTCDRPSPSLCNAKASCYGPAGLIARAQGLSLTLQCALG
jgi:hypothetical protein